MVGGPLLTFFHNGDFYENYADLCTSYYWLWWGGDLSQSNWEGITGISVQKRQWDTDFQRKKGQWYIDTGAGARWGGVGGYHTGSQCKKVKATQ